MRVRLLTIAVFYGTTLADPPIAAAGSQLPPPVESPSPQMLVAAALRVAGYAETPPNWRGRARWAALLPRISLRLAHGRGSASYFDLRPDAPDAWDANARANLSVGIRASWQLDRLLFDSREVAAREAVRKELRSRERLASRVLELFFRQLKLKALLSRGRSKAGARARADDEEHLSWQIEIARTAAVLHQLTGGAFRPDGIGPADILEDRQRNQLR